VDHESAELIERQMEETRESLTEKVAQLEEQVVGTIQSATSAVQDTVQSVRSAVQDTVDSVSGTVKHSVESVSAGVKDALDVPRHVRDHPWPMVGGAAIAGFLTGMLVFRRAPTAKPAPAFTPRSVAETPMTTAAHRPGWLNDLLEMAGREMRQLAEQAFAVASTSLRRSVQEGIPKLVERALPEIEPSRKEPSRFGGNGRSPYADMGQL
jgi:ElaB/YqjD/DUF883 family membrane-anchored ribosome-binding protein